MLRKKLRYLALSAVAFVGGGAIGGMLLSKALSGAEAGWGDLIGMILGMILGSGIGAGLVLVLALRTRTKSKLAKLGGFLAMVIGVYACFAAAGLLGVAGAAFLLAFMFVQTATWLAVGRNKSTDGGEIA